MSARFISPEEPPEGLERELLTVLAEECCEVGQRVSKALRFGLAEVQPGQLLTNAARIGEEVGDLLCVVDRLVEIGVLSHSEIESAVTQKSAKLDRYLQTAEEPKP